jgi:hypothetical protein
MPVLHINGVPVRVFFLGGNCFAVVGARGRDQRACSGDSIGEVLGKVRDLLVRHHAVKFAAA